MVEVGTEPIRGHRITHYLGSGGFGQVWAATAPDGSPRALKFLDCRDKPASTVAREVRMMRGLCELRHPRFIRLYDVCATAHYLVLSMERADGTLYDLEAAYRQEGVRSIAPEHLLELFDQAAEALDFLAGYRLPGQGLAAGGLQHCDIKPSNLLLVGDCLKVADFGLCSSTLRSGVRGFMGTVPYAAPELHAGRASCRTDQFALAVTWCELTAGDRLVIKPPSGRRHHPQQGIPLDLSKVRDREYPVLARALDPRWTNRWPSCRDFLAELRKAVQAPRSGVRRLPRRPAQPSPAAYPARP